MTHRDAARAGGFAAPAEPDGSARDAFHMQRALALAERGRGHVHPNPLVGCVLTQGDVIVGEGFHPRPGAPHAEAIALAQAGDAARGATAYVTLEPCAHHGRTPPCADALIAAGVARVLFCIPDPDPRVTGAGAARLTAAGVRVEVGLLAAEAERQNAAYLTHRRLGRPWVRYKTAMTLDGKIATRTGRSRWITGPESRALVHRLRAEADAIAVGVATVLHDDPALTTRLEGDGGGRPEGDSVGRPEGDSVGRPEGDGVGRTPRKVVFDTVARTPTTARLFDPAPDGAKADVTIVVGGDAPAARTDALAARGARILRAGDHGRPDVTAALRTLAAEGVVELLLEGGGTLAWSFLEAGAIDRVAWFIAPKLLGGRGGSPLGGLGVAAMDDAFTLADATHRRIGDDILIEGRPTPSREP